MKMGKLRSSYKFGMQLIILVLFGQTMLLGATTENPISHNSYIDAIAYAGSVTGAEYASDGDWNTYAQVTSNGNHIDAIVWHVDEEWNLPLGTLTAYFNATIEAPDPYVWQGEQSVHFWNYTTNAWDQVLLGGSYDFEVPPPLSGMLEASVELSPEWISATGDIKSNLYFF
jgi:hypothetical protein